MGSFLNVVSLRYDPDKFVFDLRQLGGRSHCPNCLKELNWHELVPILSFFIQQRRCRGCGAKISWQYPIIEFLTGIFFVAVPIFLSKAVFLIFGNFTSINFWNFMVFEAVWVAIFSLLILLSLIDIKHYIIPDAINISLFALGILDILLISRLGFFDDFYGSFLGGLGSIMGFRSDIWANHFWAMFLGFALFAAIIVLSRGRAMGWGDVKLAAALGLIFGWPDFIMVLFFAFVCGSAISLILMVMGKKTRKDVVPFGPFLALGAILTFFGGYWFMKIYFGLFSLV